MEVFLSTLNQTAYLFSFIIIGFILAKCKILPDNAAKTLSKLENTIFIPALVMGTFIDKFTVDSIKTAWLILLISFAIAICAIFFAILVSRLITKDSYIRNIYTYGLSFSNFGFMGNAVVESLFPDIFFDYLIFTLPLWTLIYVWGAPKLLLADSEQRQTFKESLKSFVNPMFIGMIIGMIIGILSIPMPKFVVSVIDAAGSCMSPIAMILTGIVVSTIPIAKTFTNFSIYVVSIIRLAVIPLLFILIALVIHMPENIYLCAVCSLAMPLGLNTIVIPSSLGKDTTVAAEMAIVSHLLSCISIPLIFMLVL